MSSVSFVSSAFCRDLFPPVRRTVIKRSDQESEEYVRAVKRRKEEGERQAVRTKQLEGEVWPLKISLSLAEDGGGGFWL